MLESKEFNHKRSYIVNITQRHGPEFRSSIYLTNIMADFMESVTINTFKIRRYIKLFNPSKYSTEVLLRNEAKWNHLINDLYDEILNAAAMVVAKPGAKADMIEPMVDAVTNEYQDFLSDYNKAVANRCVIAFKEAKVIAKDVDASSQSIQYELHGCEAKVAVTNIAHTEDEHAGTESIQRGHQMIAYNSQVDVAGKERDPAAMEVYNLSLGVQEEVVNDVELLMECGNAVTRYPRVYSATAKLNTNGYRYLYKCEEVRGQLDEVEVLYNCAAISSRDKVNFHNNKFQYHRNGG